MLKQKLSEAEFAGLNEILQTEYTKKDDGIYYLQTDESKELVNALERLKEKNKGNEELVAQINAQLKEAKDEVARKNGDIASLEKSWKERQKQRDAELEKEKEELKAVAREGYLDSILSPMTKLFDLPERHVRRDFAERISVTFENGRPVHHVLDKEGKVSAMSLEDLQKEFLADDNYSKYIIQSRGSGSAGTPAYRPGASGQPKTFSQMSPEEQRAVIEANHIKK